MDSMCAEQEIWPRPKQTLFVHQPAAPEVYQSSRGAGSSHSEMLEVIPNYFSKNSEVCDSGGPCESEVARVLGDVHVIMPTQFRTL